MTEIDPKIAAAVWQVYGNYLLGFEPHEGKGIEAMIVALERYEELRPVDRAEAKLKPYLNVYNEEVIARVQRWFDAPPDDEQVSTVLAILGDLTELIEQLRGTESARANAIMRLGDMKHQADLDREEIAALKAELATAYEDLGPPR